MAPNPYIMAADNSPALLPLLREKPDLAAQQDEHGYSLVHAAASYNHLDLLRTLVRELHVPVDLRDEDAETALFVVETVDAARCLVEELGLDAEIRGDEGMTAAEKIAAEGDFPLVADYLHGISKKDNGDGVLVDGNLPTPPEGLSVRVGALPVSEGNDIANGVVDGTEPDPEFRRRIEALASRDDFHTEEGQAALRQLVEDALSGQDSTEDRNVRARQD